MAQLAIAPTVNIRYQAFARQGHREGMGESIKEQFTFYAIGLGSEAGEVLGDIMKFCYYGNSKVDRQKIILELGDMMWYIANICELLGTNIDEVELANIAKLTERYPDRCA
jgi:NTP pyrophosphatase (non-canonical NTP hydrolase)